MTDDLKPCPFCGGKLIAHGVDGKDMVSVWCKCGARGPDFGYDVFKGSEDIALAHQAWNTRTPAVAETLTCIHMTAEMAESCPTCNPGLPLSPDTQDAAPERIWVCPLGVHENEVDWTEGNWTDQPEFCGSETEYVPADLLATARTNALEEAAVRMDAAVEVMRRSGSFREVTAYQNAAKAIRKLKETDQ